MSPFLSHVVLSLVGHYVTLSGGTYMIGDDIPSKVEFSRRVDTTIIRRFVGISLHDCAVECGLRSSCSGMNYERMVKMCELLGHTSPIIRPERSKRWVYLGMTDNIRETVMRKYCDQRRNCPAGQTCTREGMEYQCSIEECGEPPFALDDYLPKEGKTLHVGSKIRVKYDDDEWYRVQCCPNGNWAQDCSAPISSTSTSSRTSTSTSSSPSTSTSTSTSISTSSSSTASTSTSTTSSISVSTSTTSENPAFKIGEDEWYTMTYRNETREVVFVNTATLSWKYALNVCDQNGGTLAHVYDESELLMIGTWLAGYNNNAQIWVGGLYDTNDDAWVWHTEFGTDLLIDSYLWGTDQPSQDDRRACISLYRDNLRYDERYLGNEECGLQFSFVCERYPTVGTTGITGS